MFKAKIVILKPKKLNFLTKNILEKYNILI